MKEKLIKGYRYIEKRRKIFPKLLFHSGGGIAILMLLYTLFDLQSILSADNFADIEERTILLCQYALLSGIIPMAAGALMKRMEDREEE